MATSDWLPSQASPSRADAATGSMVLFGGENIRHGHSHFLSDTWTWDGTTWTEQAPAAHPRTRFGAAMAYDATTRTVVLFGGAPHGGGLLSDTWTWG